jgi:starvation-inducible DNA-binding protein
MTTKTIDKVSAGHGKDGSARTRSFRSPAPLATPRDLKPEEVQAVTEAVNPLIADGFALYVKSKNFH